jgi:predicted transcriptional regulator of viral defense system
MSVIAARIDKLGGLASMRELVLQGLERDWVQIAHRYGKIVRIRDGWYTTPIALAENESAVIQAWRSGGKLACISALAHYGLASEPSVVHVALPGNAVRRRDSGDMVVHWCRADPGGDRTAVSLGSAVRQASRCGHVLRDSL